MRSFGPGRSARIARRRPVASAAARRSAMIVACSSNVPWAKLSRATFIPASIIAAIVARAREAGPMVHTILVLTSRWLMSPRILRQRPPSHFASGTASLTGALVNLPPGETCAAPGGRKLGRSGGPDCGRALALLGAICVRSARSMNSAVGASCQGNAPARTSGEPAAGRFHQSRGTQEPVQLGRLTSLEGRQSPRAGGTTQVYQNAATATPAEMASTRSSSALSRSMAGAPSTPGDAAGRHPAGRIAPSKR